MSTDTRIRRLPSEAILDALPDAVLVVDGGVIVEANAAAMSAFAIDGALVGLPVRDVLAGGEWERLELLDAQRARGWIVPAMCRVRFKRSSGDTDTFDVRFSHLGGSQIVLAARDAAYMTRAEDLVGRLAHLPSGMDGADALLDASEPVFEVLGWKVAFTQMLDGGSKTLRMLAPVGDPVGDYGRSLIGKLNPIERTPILAEVLRTGEALFLDNLPTTQKGLVRGAVALSDSMAAAGIARSAWCPIREGGRITHILSATGAEITEHDFVAIQLFAAQLGAAMRLRALRLEMVHRERLAAVGEMAAVLAHEVRNPLGVMFTALGTLGRADPAKRGEWQALLDILQDEANRLERLVTDLLEFSSASTPVLEAESLGPIARDAMHAAEYDPAFSMAQPEVRVDVPEDLLVRTDRVLLRRVLLNIIVNAFQHVRRGGNVEVIAEASHDEVALTISNDGPPIPAAVATRVFEPFFTTQPTGTGLGLAIVRRVCTDVGASVSIVPREVGASFRILLPRGR